MLVVNSKSYFIPSSNQEFEVMTREIKLHHSRKLKKKDDIDIGRPISILQLFASAILYLNLLNIELMMTGKIKKPCINNELTII